jgi:hypothetical protein
MYERVKLGLNVRRDRYMTGTEGLVARALSYGNALRELTSHDRMERSARRLFVCVLCQWLDLVPFNEWSAMEVSSTHGAARPRFLYDSTEALAARNQAYGSSTCSTPSGSTLGDGFDLDPGWILVVSSTCLVEALEGVKKQWTFGTFVLNRNQRPSKVSDIR